VNPHRTENSSVGTSNPIPAQKSSISDTTQTPAKLSPAPSSQSSIKTTAPSSSAPAGGGQSGKTDTPQPKAEAGKGLQSAVPNDQGGSITYKVTQPIRQTLDNLKP
jgi:hypothetical protein